MTEVAHTENEVHHASHNVGTMAEVLHALEGMVVTVANSESYEDAPVGHRLTSGFYKAKVAHVGQDHIVLLTEVKHVRSNLPDEPAKQFIPTSRIKRLSVLRSEKVLHI